MFLHQQQHDVALALKGEAEEGGGGLQALAPDIGDNGAAGAAALSCGVDDDLGLGIAYHGNYQLEFHCWLPGCGVAVSVSNRERAASRFLRRAAIQAPAWA